MTSHEPTAYCTEIFVFCAGSCTSEQPAAFEMFSRLHHVTMFSWLVYGSTD